MRISDWSSDVCSSDLLGGALRQNAARHAEAVAGFPCRRQCGALSVEGVRRQPLRFHQGTERCQRAASAVEARADAGRRQPRRARRARICRKIFPAERSEEHTSELQSLMRISYAVFCLKKK